MLQNVITCLKTLNVDAALKNVVGKLKNATPKTWMRIALCLVAVFSIATGGLLLDELIIVDGNSLYHVTAHAESVEEAINSNAAKSSNNVIITKDKNGKTIITIDRSNQWQVKPLFGGTSGNLFPTRGNYSYSPELLIPANDGTANVQNTGVCYVYETVTEIIKHDYATVKSRDLEKGTTVVSAGSDGEKQIVYKKTIVNGVEIATEVYSETVVTKPVTQVETVGTRVSYSSDKTAMTSDDVDCISQIKPDKPIELDANGVPVSYVDCISGKASAYWGDKWTAVGLESKPGYIAVNPEQIPYGTKMYIVSQDGKYVYGYCIAADTGGFAYNGSGRLVDLRFPTSASGSKFGVRMVNIYILE